MKNKTKNKQNNFPLVIVFYLDAEMMAVKEIMNPFVDSINEMISRKGENILAFFLPTKGEERIEVLNPTIIAEPDMEKINKVIEDIKTNFSIGVDMGDIGDDIEITIDDDE
jgi:hypothetical protein